MNYGEPVAAKRRIPVYLVDSSADPVTGVSPTGSEIQVSQSGDPFANAAGTWVELADGAYYYEATIGEVSTASYLLLKIVVAGVKRFIWVVDIDERIIVNEPSVLRRHIPIYLVDGAGDPVTGVTLTGSEIQISKAGGTFANATGTVTEVAQGVYDYEATLANVDTEGALLLKVIDAAAEPYLYAVGIVSGTASEGGGGGYYGAYFGATTVEVGASGPAAPPTPIESPITSSDPEFVDHIQAAIDRLCQYAKAKA